MTALACFAITWVPGFGALEYYYALAASVPIAIASLMLGAAAGAGWRRANAPTSLAHAAGKAVLASLVQSAAALFVIALGALRIRNCNPWIGFCFFALGPLAGGAYSAALGTVLGAWLRRPGRAFALGIGLTFISVARHLWVFLTEPRIFFYDPFLGYWSGAVYDEVIGVSSAYYWFRLACGVDVAFLLVAGGWAMAQPPRASSRPLQWATAGLGAIAFAFAWHGGFLGYAPTRSTVQAELDGEYETAHFAIHYPTSSKSVARTIEFVGEDCEFRYSQLEALFGESYPKRIHVYVYSSRAQKRRLMGADRVYIAKPWLDETHLAPLDFGNPTLKHEIAHVFAAQYASGPLHVASHWGLVPHMGLIEGLATATEGYRDRLTLHQWSAALLELQKLPDMVAIMGPQGYWSSYGPTAYTTAGSLLLFIAETKGVTALETLYGSGDWAEATGSSLPELVSAWKGFLSDRSLVPLGSGELERARFRYDHKPVFQRACPLAVASAESQATALEAAGQRRSALELREQVVRWRQGDPLKRFALAQALGAAGELDRAAAEAENVAADERSSFFLKARAQEFLADLAWKAGDTEKAHTEYTRLLDAPLELADHRRIEAKLLGLEAPSPDVRETVRDYLTPGRSEGGWTPRLAALHMTHPESGVIAYLLGYRAIANHRPLEALVPLLWALERSNLTSVRLRAEAWFRVGEAWYFAGNTDAATEAFRQAAALLPSEAGGEQARMTDWIARAQWLDSVPNIASTRPTSTPTLATRPLQPADTYILYATAESHTTQCDCETSPEWQLRQGSVRK